jgi:hypothetical protein
MTDEETQAFYKMRYETYLSHRQTLVQTESDQIRSFDKSILSVAFGALGLSIAFSDKIGSNHPIYAFILYASWLILCFCILSTTCSFLVAAHASARQREIFDETFDNESPTPGTCNSYAAWVTRLNILSLGLIFTGTLCLTLFAVANFDRRSTPGDVQAAAESRAASSREFDESLCSAEGSKDRGGAVTGTAASNAPESPAAPSTGTATSNAPESPAAPAAPSETSALKTGIAPHDAKAIGQER